MEVGHYAGSPPALNPVCPGGVPDQVTGLAARADQRYFRARDGRRPGWYISLLLAARTAWHAPGRLVYGTTLAAAAGRKGRGRGTLSTELLPPPDAHRPSPIGHRPSPISHRPSACRRMTADQARVSPRRKITAPSCFQTGTERVRQLVYKQPFLER